MSEVGIYSVEGEIGIVSINSPPVNALGLSILAFEKEIELRIVIDFLTGA